MTLIRRGLESKILRTLDVPVVILEGARAVGKTTLAREQIASRRNYDYVTLIDTAVLASAKRDIDEWLRGLSRPVIIDEAQLCPELPLALKRLTDGAANDFGQVLLTGSASIGRAGLDGADPLVRRSVRFEMAPLTRWELNDQTGSIVDFLFDADIGYRGTTSLDLVHDLTFGGFPAYAVPVGPLTRQRLHDRIRSDITGLVSDQIIPDAGLDPATTRQVLDLLLRVPGAIFNASRLAQQLELDRRTVDRYVAVLERLFLVHRLPNLATSPSRQNLARAKVHPVDTSFSVESLARAGVDVRTDRIALGAVLESYVVNQILAARSWAEMSVEVGFWRKASRESPEVDLVLEDSSGRLVGVEIKAAASVNDRDARGLIALKAASSLHRGFVFYSGPRAFQIRDDIWAMPIGALGDHSYFSSPAEMPPPTRETINMPPEQGPITPEYDATVFLSYVHDDNVRAGDRIVKFAKDLVETYAFLFGHQLQLFIDRDDIRWGEIWQDRLSRELQTTSFLVSVITPRYLKSAACRREVLEFAAAARQASDPRLLLPLQWVDISGTDVVAADDPVLQQVRASQIEDVTAVRMMAAGSIEYETLLERVARRLRGTILGEGGGSELAAQDGPDLFDIQSRIERQLVEFEPATIRFKDAFEEIADVFNTTPPLAAGTPQARAAALQALGAELNTPAQHLETATAELSELWKQLDDDFSRAISILADNPDETQRSELAGQLDALARSFDLPGLEVLGPQLTMVGNASRHLRPMSRAIGGAIRLLQGIQGSATAWKSRL